LDWSAGRLALSVLSGHPADWFFLPVRPTGPFWLADWYYLSFLAIWLIGPIWSSDWYYLAGHLILF
jgi:hypothetical protein